MRTATSLVLFGVGAALAPLESSGGSLPPIDGLRA